MWLARRAPPIELERVLDLNDLPSAQRNLCTVKARLPPEPSAYVDFHFVERAQSMIEAATIYLCQQLSGHLTTGMPVLLIDTTFESKNCQDLMPNAAKHAWATS